MIVEKFAMRMAGALALGATAVIVAGCASYSAKPIEPAMTAAALEQRTLADRTLARFIADVLPDRAADAGATRDP